MVGVNGRVGSRARFGTHKGECKLGGPSLACIAHDGSGIFGPKNVPCVFSYSGDRAGIDGLWGGFGAKELGLGFDADREFADGDRGVAGVPDSFGGSGIEGGFGG